MRKAFFVFSAILVILISGCNQNDMDGKISELHDEFIALQTKMDSQNETIINQKILLGEYEEKVNVLSSNVALLQDWMEMINTSQGVTSSIVENISHFKYGLLQKYDESNMTIKFAEMTYEENQFTGLNISDELVEIRVDQYLPIFLFIKSGNLVPELVNWKDTQNNDLTGKFLKLYYKDGKVVAIQEIYLP